MPSSLDPLLGVVHVALGADEVQAFRWADDGAATVVARWPVVGRDRATSLTIDRHALERAGGFVFEGERPSHLVAQATEARPGPARAALVIAPEAVGGVLALWRDAEPDRRAVAAFEARVDTLGAAIAAAITCESADVEQSHVTALRARATNAEARSRAALAASPDPCFLLATAHDARGGVSDFVFIGANAGAGALYDIPADDLVGLSLGELFPVLRGTPTWDAYVDVATTGTRYESEYQTRDPRAVAGWLGLQVVAWRGEGDAILGLAVTARDITARKRAEREGRLLNAVTLALGEAPDGAGALGAALGVLCDASEMSYGEAWMPASAFDVTRAPDSVGEHVTAETLVRGPVWHAPDDVALAAFARASTAFSFPHGQGLPGRAAAAGAPVWIPDVTAARANFPRATHAIAAGIRGGFAVPVLADGRLVAVLCFHTRDTAARAAARDELVAVIAQIGTVLSRRQAEAELARERSFLAAVIDSLSEGIVVRSTDGGYRLCNRAMRELHGVHAAPNTPDDWSRWHTHQYEPESDRPLPQDALPLYVALAEQRDVRDVELVVAPEGGVRRTVITNARVIRSPSGEFLGAVSASRDLTAQKTAEVALARERAFVDSVLNSLSESVSACDASGRLILFNRATRELHGMPAEGSLPPEQWSSHYAVYLPDGVTPFPAESLPLVRALTTGAEVDDVAYVVAPTHDELAARGPRTLVANARLLRGPDGEVLGAVCAARDMTAQQAAERAMRESEARFRGVLENLSAFAVQLDAAGRITFVNDALLAATGWTRDDVVGADDVGRYLSDAASIRRVIARAVATGDVTALASHHESELLTRGGGRRLVAWDNVALRDAHGGVTGVASVGRDVTDERHLAAERERLVAVLADLAEQDELTGLANRRGFARMAAQERRGASRSGRVDAVCCVDLDRFKAINDSFGHAAGDDALRAVARVIRDTIRGADFAARLGGDEFAVYAVGITQANGAQIMAGRLHAALVAHNRVATAAGRPYEIAFSVGVHEVGPDETLEAALACADAALYAAKGELRGARA